MTEPYALTAMLGYLAFLLSAFALFAYWLARPRMHKHCWHSNEVLTSDPPQLGQRCCHCNESRIVALSDGRDVRSHGPFAQLKS